MIAVAWHDKASWISRMEAGIFICKFGKEEGSPALNKPLKVGFACTQMKTESRNPLNSQTVHICVEMG